VERRHRHVRHALRVSAFLGRSGPVRKARRRSDLQAGKQEKTLEKNLKIAQIKKGFTAKTKPGFGAFFPASFNVSDSAKDLIGKMLSSDVADRLTADEALAHPWLKGDTASEDPIAESVRNSFVKFHNKNKFREAILGTMIDVLPKVRIREKIVVIL
jgi:serine/threonine protein kinase